MALNLIKNLHKEARVHQVVAPHYTVYYYLLSSRVEVDEGRVVYSDHDSASLRKALPFTRSEIDFYLKRLEESGVIRFNTEGFIVLGKKIGEGYSLLGGEEGSEDLQDIKSKTNKFVQEYKRSLTPRREYKATECGEELTLLFSKTPIDWIRGDYFSFFSCLYQVVYFEECSPFTPKERGQLDHLRRSFKGGILIKIMFEYITNSTAYNSTGVPTIGTMLMKKTLLYAKITGTKVDVEGRKKYSETRRAEGTF